MKSVQDNVKEDVSKLTSTSATIDGLRFLRLPVIDENYTAANKYIAALEIIRDLTNEDLRGRIAVSKLTKEQWVKYNWIDVTEMGYSERMAIRGWERFPDEAAEALRDWEFLHHEVR